jgi:hypothetical protein
MDGFTNKQRILEETIVTFKTSNKIISTPTNRTASWKTESEKQPKKIFKEQNRMLNGWQLDGLCLKNHWGIQLKETKCSLKTH